MSAFDQGPLTKYNSLTDRHLVNYFSNDRMRRHLVKNGLITRDGEVVPDAVYRVRMARREHRKKVRCMIAQAIIYKALEMERSRQIDIRKKIEEIAKLELVKRVKADRSKIGDEDYTPYFEPGNMEIRGDATRKTVKKSMVDSEENRLPTTSEDESRKRLRQLLPHEEIETKHLAQLDTLTLHEYAKILESQEKNRINRLPYLGMGREFPYGKPKKLKAIKKKKNKRKNNKEEDTAVNTGRSTQSKGQSHAVISFLFHAPNNKGKYNVSVEQQPFGGNTLTLFHGDLEDEMVFTMESKRHKGYPFSLTFYIDGVKDCRVSTCCEYKHKPGVRIGGPKGHFTYYSVDGDNRCYRCLAEEDLKQSKSKKHGEKSSDGKSSPHETISVNESEEEDDEENVEDEEQEENTEEEVDKDKHSESEEEDNDFGSISGSDKEDKDKDVSRTDDENREEIEMEAAYDEEKFEENSEEKVEVTEVKALNDQPLEVSSDEDKKISEEENKNILVSQDSLPNNENFELEYEENKKEDQIQDERADIEFATFHRQLSFDFDQNLEFVDEDDNRIKVSESRNFQFKEDSNAHKDNHFNYTKEKQSSDEKSEAEDKVVSPVVVKEKQPEFISNENNKISPDLLEESPEIDKSDESIENKQETKNELLKPVMLVPAGISRDSSKSDTIDDSSSSSASLIPPTETGPKLTKESSIQQQSSSSYSSTSSSTSIKLPAQPKPITNSEVPQEQYPNSLTDNDDLKLNLKQSKNLNNNLESDDESTVASSQRTISHTSPSASSSTIVEGIRNQQLPTTSTNVTTDVQHQDKIEVAKQYDNVDDDDEFVVDTVQISHDHRDSESSSSESDTGSIKSPNNRINYQESPELRAETPEELKVGNRISIESQSEEKHGYQPGSSVEHKDNIPLIQQKEIEAGYSIEPTAPIIEASKEFNGDKDHTNDEIFGENIVLQNEILTFGKIKQFCGNYADKKIRSLKIQDCELESYIFDYLVQHMPSLSDLESLCLSNCEIELSLLRILSNSMMNWTSLNTLILSNNEFMENSLQTTLNAIQMIFSSYSESNRTMKLLNLAHCDIKPNDFAQIVDCIESGCKIEQLILSENMIDDAQFMALANAVEKNNNIKSIVIRNCEIYSQSLDQLDESVRSKFVL